MSNEDNENNGAQEERVEDTLPDYLKDEPPDRKAKTKYIKWSLMHGKMEEELKTEGSNPRSVDICAQELERDHHRDRPPKLLKEDNPLSTVTVSKPAGKDVQIFAKGSPPEALINSMCIPFVDGQTEGFEHGMKFGASMVVLGVRIAQELSGIGAQMARPLIDMTREARTGEAQAAKNASAEAAMMAAAQVQQNLAPYLANISKTPEGADPMKGMMARVMEPIIGRLMSSVIPGAKNAPPPGWVTRQE